MIVTRTVPAAPPRTLGSAARIRGGAAPWFPMNNTLTCAACPGVKGFHSNNSAIVIQEMLTLNCRRHQLSIPPNGTIIRCCIIAPCSSIA